MICEFLKDGLPGGGQFTGEYNIEAPVTCLPGGSQPVVQILGMNIETVAKGIIVGKGNGPERILHLSVDI